MALRVTTERRRLVTQLHAHRRARGAFDLRSYLGSPVPVLGLTTPELRAILNSFVADHPALSEREVNDLAAAMWRGRTVEEKFLAISLLSRYAHVLRDASWKLADSWVDAATGWALSDGLASGPISTMLREDPHRFREVLAWTKAKNYWRRRASTYALNELVRGGDLDRPFRLLERLLYDGEFWVQRAVGTWLRECWKVDRRRTEAFLRRHVNGLPPVTITVATERASKAFREELRRKSKSKRASRSVRTA